MKRQKYLACKHINLACSVLLTLFFYTAVQAENRAATNKTQASAMTVKQEVSFERDVLPKLVKQCGYCHQSYDRHGYLVLDGENTYETLVNVPSYQLPSMLRVAPGEPEQSYLWRKSVGSHVEAGGKGWEMPVMIGVRGELKDQLFRWIAAGAKNN